MFDVELMEHLQAGDVLLGAACTVPACVLPPWRAGGVDMLTRLHCSRAWPKGAHGDDVTVQWRWPSSSARPQHVTLEEWEALPAAITVRGIEAAYPR